MVKSATLAIQQLTSEQAWYFRAIPTRFDEKSIDLLVDADFDSGSLLRELELILGRTVSISTISEVELSKKLIKYYHKSAGTKQFKGVDTRDLANFLESLIGEAKEMSSSDIHIEPSAESGRVRMRLDGHLREKYVIDLKDYGAFINRIKVISNLDISEKRLPQDGRISFGSGHDKFDLRVSTLPTIHGEKVVMRILSNDASHLEMEKIGMKSEYLELFRRATSKSNGIILVSGPTGSGKTTTLYAALKELNKDDQNIITIEDPIEYTLNGINQVQVKESIGLSFSKVLKSVLRQDPDIIMIGEIRDQETAELAVRSALTGHLVLSTIHTNSAAATIDRLIDLGIPRFLINSTLSLSVAQRLVRKLCVVCKNQKQIKLIVRDEDKVVANKLFFSKGCESCHYSGYAGRKAIYEMIPMTSEIKSYFSSGNVENEFYQSRNITTLADSAYEILLAGETSFEEVSPFLNHKFLLSE